MFRPESIRRFASTTFKRTSGNAFCFTTKYSVVCFIVLPLVRAFTSMESFCLCCANNCVLLCAFRAHLSVTERYHSTITKYKQENLCIFMSTIALPGGKPPSGAKTPILSGWRNTLWLAKYSLAGEKHNKNRKRQVFITEIFFFSIIKLVPSFFLSRILAQKPLKPLSFLEYPAQNRPISWIKKAIFLFLSHTALHRRHFDIRTQLFFPKHINFFFFMNKRKFLCRGKLCYD